MTDGQGYVNTTKVLFRPIKRLKLIGTHNENLPPEL